MKIAFNEKLSLLHLGDDHPMRGDRYQRAVRRFRELGLEFELEDFSMAAEEDLLLFHTREYVEKVKKISERGWPDISPDTPGFKGVFEAASWSVGATLKALELAEQEGIGVNLAGGWHHAFPETGRGFCIFSDTGVAIAKLKRKGLKVMIVDYDAHHGDGIQRAYGSDPQVITVSFHQDPSTLYPYLTGFLEETHETNLNLPLPPLSGADEILYAFSHLIPPLIDKHRPDFLIVEMGVDGHCSCYVANLSISKRGYLRLGETLGEVRYKYNLPMVLVGGGGFVYPHYADCWALQLAGLQGRSMDLELDDCPGGRNLGRVKELVDRAKSLARLP